MKLDTKKVYNRKIEEILKKNSFILKKLNIVYTPLIFKQRIFI